MSIEFDDTTPETENANGRDTAAFSDMTRPLIPRQTGPADAADRTDTPPAADTEPEDSHEDDDGTAPVNVDQGADSGPDRLGALLAAKRRPILADWARSIEDFKRTAGFVAGHFWHSVKYHTVRAPWYAGKLAGRSPRGLGRILRKVFAYVADREGHPIRRDAVDRLDAGLWLKLHEKHVARVRARALGSGLAVLALGALGYLGLSALTGPEDGLLIAAGIAVLGFLGAPADAPLTSRAVVKPQYLKLTSDVVLRALGALGIPEVRQAVERGGRGLSFVTPITQDGPGWRAEVDLPFGVTAVDVMEKRAELASGLRRPLGCVWPEPVHDEHSGRLVIWVGREEMRQAKRQPWPLATGKPFDLFKPVPFATDQRGRLVTVPLVENNVLIGALPGGGKSFSAQPLIYAAGLDPKAKVWSANLKGDGFHKNTAQFAERYIDGIDDDAVLAVLEMLRDLKTETLRRAKVFKSLPPSINPDGKINPQIAGKSSLGLPLLVVFIDEVQNLFKHKDHGAEAGDLAEFNIKVGRALGVILVLATQRPDKDSLPTGVSSSTSIRFCLRVMGQTENDMILGTSAYKNGIRSTQFTVKDKGIGYLVGASEEPQIAHTFFLDQTQTAAIGAKARALREAAGTLTGYALDPDGQAENDKPTARTVVDDLAEIFPVVGFTNDKVWGEELLRHLTEHRPDAYDGWEVETLTAALKPHGVRSTDITRRIDGKSTTRKGYTRPALAEAVTNRNQKSA